MGTALATTPKLERPPSTVEFDLPRMQIFTHVPEHRDSGIVVLEGMVFVFDRHLVRVEGFLEGSFYVREHQRPVAGMSWETHDRLNREHGRQMRSRIDVDREVVQAIRWPSAKEWALRLASGFVDGPYYDWGFGHDLIGKVVGIYRPETGRAN